MLILFEIKKALSTRGFKAFCIILLVFSVFSGILFSNVNAPDKDKVEQIIESYIDSPDAARAKYEEKKQALEEYKELILSEFDGVRMPDELRDFDEYNAAFAAIDRQEAYIKRLDKALCELEKQPSSGLNDLLTEAYGRNRSLNLGRSYVFGVEELFKLLALVAPAVFLVCIYLGISLAFAERRRGSELLVHSTYRGRTNAFAAKAVSLVLGCALASLGACVISVGTFSLLSGFSCFGAYIQCVSAFALYPLPLTVLQAVLIIWLLMTCCGCFLGLFTCVVSRFCRNEALPLAAACVLIIVNLILSASTSRISGDMIKISGVFSLCDGTRLFAHVYPAHILGRVFYGVTVVIAAYLALSLIFAGIFILLKASAVEYKPLGRYISIKLPAPRRLNGTFGFEAYKQLVAKKGVLLILAAIVIKICLSAPVYDVRPTYTMQKYKEYMTSFAGDFTDEKYEEARLLLESSVEVVSKKDEMQKKFLAHEITRSEMGEYLCEYYEALQDRDALTLVIDRLEYAASQPGASVVYDTGWHTLFSLGPDLTLLLLCVALMCGLFSDEFASRMNLLYGGSKRNVAKAKIKYALLVPLVGIIIFSPVDIICISASYGLPEAGAKVCSIIPSLFGSLPIFAYILLKYVAFYAISALISLFTSFVSYVTRSKVIAFVLAAAAVIILI